ncbi:hypothetical protein [Massilia glaciei]|uniref:Uncharacterized protein n=1 Tax=Massilia glaciei TaxID=1524097 RepID=A0A2U2I4H3_9BURK|nr:hypothetical protein [Massilia glaciei]PWF54633.1 hypothetical protein C7C56_006045 [Massilia glaciei]
MFILFYDRSADRSLTNYISMFAVLLVSVLLGQRAEARAIKNAQHKRDRELAESLPGELEAFKAKKNDVDGGAP